jgi:hypothetical protein
MIFVVFALRIFQCAVTGASVGVQSTSDRVLNVTHGCRPSFVVDDLARDSILSPKRISKIDKISRSVHMQLHFDALHLGGVTGDPWL